MQNLQKKIKRFWDKRFFLKKNLKVCCKDLLLIKLKNNIILKYIKKNQKILDIGCGNREIIKFIIKKIYYKKITGVDSNENLLKAVKVGTDKNDNFIKFNLLHDDYSILKKLKSDTIICKKVVCNFDYIYQKSILKKFFYKLKNIEGMGMNYFILGKKY